MEHFDWQQKLKTLWQKALDLYAGGNEDPQTYFTEEETAWLASVGIRPRELYDFAEDFNAESIPDFPTVAMIQDIRRSYFRDVQGGQWTGRRIDPTQLPAKDSEAAGIVWLPRIIAKAKAKLHGELDEDTMYSCPGDRRFLKANDIHPAEFLRTVWQHEKDDVAIVAWVERRVRKA